MSSEERRRDKWSSRRRNTSASNTSRCWHFWAHASTKAQLLSCLASPVITATWDADNWRGSTLRDTLSHLCTYCTNANFTGCAGNWRPPDQMYSSDDCMLLCHQSNPDIHSCGRQEYSNCAALIRRNQQLWLVLQPITPRNCRKWW